MKKTLRFGGEDEQKTKKEQEEEEEEAANLNAFLEKNIFEYYCLIISFFLSLFSLFVLPSSLPPRWDLV